MAKRWKKQKAGSQKRKKRRPGGGGGDASSSKGAMTGLRGGFKNVARGKLFDILLWVAVGVAAFFFFRDRCA